MFETAEKRVNNRYKTVTYWKDGILVGRKCTVCGEENYIGDKNKKLHPERIEILKFCKRCNKKTTHKEKK